MEHVRFVGEPALRDPALVVAFTGWGDAGAAASSAALLLLRGRSISQVVAFDTEAFYVLTSARPLVRELAEGRQIVWASLGLLAGKASGTERDLVVLVAAEPQMRWQAFSRAVAESWVELGGGPAMLLGSFLAQQLSAGPAALFGTASTARLTTQLGALDVIPNSYQGPTTALTSIYEALAVRGVPCAEVWAAVPHLLYRLPNPKATQALLRVVCRVHGVTMDPSDLGWTATQSDTDIA